MKNLSLQKSEKSSPQKDNERIASRQAHSPQKVSWQKPSYDPAISCFLEEIYAECNRSERLELDPLAIVRRYEKPEDMEVAGLLCSTLAFGSVELIMQACEKALKPLGEHPAKALREMRRNEIEHAWAFFQYRFCFPKDMIALMSAIHEALDSYGSLEALFLKCDTISRQNTGKDPGDSVANEQKTHKGKTETDWQENILAASSTFVLKLHELALKAQPEGLRKNLLPDPCKGSAAKRLFLFLRWMIRHDEIDPGCWNSISPARLIVPMDTHMIRTCTERLRFLPRRKSAGTMASLRDALIVTEAFRLYAPEDPVKYDFALTRPGIDPRPGDERFSCL